MLLLTKNYSSSCNRTIEHIHSPKKTTLSILHKGGEGRASPLCR